MACEQAWKQFIDAMNAHVKVEEELCDLLGSWVGTPGSPLKLVIVGGEEDQRADRLIEKQAETFERYRTAQVAFMEARRTHRDD